MEVWRILQRFCRLLVVAMMLPVTVTASDIRVSTLAKVISAIHGHFSTSCLFLIHEEVQTALHRAWIRHRNLNRHLTGVRLQKLLSGREVSLATSLLGLNDLEERTRSSCSMSLCVLPFSDPSLPEGIKQMSTKIMLSHAVWLLFLDTNASLEEFFTDINIPFDCEFLVAQPENGDAIGLTEVYRVSPTHSLQTYRFGNWSPLAGLTGPSQGFYQRRNNLHGISLHVAVNNDSLTAVRAAARSGELEVGGLFGELWRVAEQYTNFTSHYSMSSLNMHGEILEDGKWNGIIGMLADRQVNISCSDLTMTTSRVEVVDFIEPVWTSRTYIFIKRHDTVAVGWTTFLIPYSWQLWVAVTATVALLVFCLAALHWVRCRHVGQTVEDLPHPGLSHAVFYVTACFCCQGSNAATRSVSGRMLHLTVYVTSVVLFASYSGALVSSIASRHATLPFRTFEEFLNNGYYRLGVLANSSIISNMKESTEIPLRKLYESILPDMSNLPRRNSEGLRRACEDEHYAYMSPLYILLTNAPICTLQTVPYAYISSTKAMATVKNSPYRLVLKQRFRSIRESGIFRQICSVTLMNLPEEEGTAFQSVSHNAVAPLLVLLLTGIGVSILIFVVERMASCKPTC